ncbi:hypothetical protein AcidC75_00960 [Acidisoma sp. C75]
MALGKGLAAGSGISAASVRPACGTEPAGAKAWRAAAGKRGAGHRPERKLVAAASFRT